ncbi:MAG: bacteriophage T4 gp5 trimerization domain-containing protein [Desulfovibrio sp.]
MLDTIKKIILRLYPELKDGLHLDKFARVKAIADPPDKGATCERFRPRYAVDIEMLTPAGEPDPNFPIYTTVPLPINIGCGHESGMLGFPEVGTVVVVGFAYGQPDHPIIRQVYPFGVSLPELQRGQQRWQQDAGVYQDVDPDGNWTRSTDNTITDQAHTIVTEAVNKIDELSALLQQVKEHSIEEVGGIKKIEAMGAVELLSGGLMDLVGVENVNVASGRDITLQAGKDRHELTGGDRVTEVKKNTSKTIDGNKTESIGGTSSATVGGSKTVNVGGSSTETVAKAKKIEAKTVELKAENFKIWNGSGASLLDIFSGFMEETRAALAVLAEHTHDNDGIKPDQENQVETHVANIGGLKGTLGGIKG